MRRPLTDISGPYPPAALRLMVEANAFEPDALEHPKRLRAEPPGVGDSENYT